MESRYAWVWIQLCNQDNLCTSVDLDGVVPLVTDPPCANSTLYKSHPSAKSNPQPPDNVGWVKYLEFYISGETAKLVLCTLINLYGVFLLLLRFHTVLGFTLYVYTANRSAATHQPLCLRHRGLVCAIGATRDANAGAAAAQFCIEVYMFLFRYDQDGSWLSS